MKCRGLNHRRPTRIWGLLSLSSTMMTISTLWMLQFLVVHNISIIIGKNFAMLNLNFISGHLWLTPSVQMLVLSTTSMSVHCAQSRWVACKNVVEAPMSTSWLGNYWLLSLLCDNFVTSQREQQLTYSNLAYLYPTCVSERGLMLLWLTRSRYAIASVARQLEGLLND